MRRIQTVETVEAAKLRILSTIDASESDIVEIQVPYEHHEVLRVWVEDQGVRCGCEIHPGRLCFLIVNLQEAPPTPVAPTDEEKV